MLYTRFDHNSKIKAIKTAILQAQGGWVLSVLGYRYDQFYDFNLNLVTGDRQYKMRFPREFIRSYLT